ARVHAGRAIQSTISNAFATMGVPQRRGQLSCRHRDSAFCRSSRQLAIVRRKQVVDDDHSDDRQRVTETQSSSTLLTGCGSRIISALRFSRSERKSSTIEPPRGNRSGRPRQERLRTRNARPTERVPPVAYAEV